MTDRKVDVSKHGTARGYALGCRCVECSTFRREYMRRYRGSPLTGLPAVSRATYNAAVRELVYRHTDELRAIVTALGEVS